jgi:plastocyanin
VTVSIHDFSFDPAQTTVSGATVVMWSNDDGVAHTVTADDGSFDSGTLNPGDTFAVMFEGSGTVPYHCEIHPSMMGSVTVSGNSGGSAPPTTGAPAGGSTDMPSGMDMGSGY